MEAVEKYQLDVYGYRPFLIIFGIGGKHLFPIFSATILHRGNKRYKAISILSCNVFLKVPRNQATEAQLQYCT